MKKDEVSELVSVACFSLMVIILLGAVFFSAGKINGQGQAMQRGTGEPPVGLPVMLYWVRDDGTLYAESAVKTDYAGIYPHSLTERPVPYQKYSDFDYWVEIESEAEE
jgi:hypothetical protein